MSMRSVRTPSKAKEKISSKEVAAEQIERTVRLFIEKKKKGFFLHIAQIYV